jgi:hypothetical protein
LAWLAASCLRSSSSCVPQELCWSNVVVVATALCTSRGHTCGHACLLDCSGFSMLCMAAGHMQAMYTGHCCRSSKLMHLTAGVCRAASCMLPTRGNVMCIQHIRCLQPHAALPASPACGQHRHGLVNSQDTAAACGASLREVCVPGLICPAAALRYGRTILCRAVLCHSWHCAEQLASRL